MTTARTLEEERKHHAWLDTIATKCSARSEANETHLGCEYCNYLAAYYNDPKARLQPRGAK